MTMLLQVDNIKKKFARSFSLMTILIATEIELVFLACTEYSRR